MLSKEEKALLTNKIKQYRDSSTNVIVVITQKTLKDTVTGEVYQLEEAAKHYFNNWGIGLKEKNNGVLFFVVKDDRKIRIATGSGIEDVLTNEDCQLIIDEHIVPNFKNKAYYKGLNEAIDQVMQTMSPELFPQVNESTGGSNEVPSAVTSQSYSYNNRNAGNDNSVIPFLILVGLIIAIVWAIIKKFGNDNSNETVYTSDGSNIPRNSNRGRWRWFFSGLLFGGFFSNRNSTSAQNNSYRYQDSGSLNNNSFDSGSSNSFSSDSFSASSSDSGSSFGGGSSDGGGASGSW